jgi:hypothetical protein
MDREALVALGSLALNSKVSSDDRFMAAYLLSLNGSSDAIAPLTEIARAELSSDADNDSSRASEISIRALAIEGLSNGPSEARPVLIALAREAQNPFLKRRALMGLRGLEAGKLNAIQESDERDLARMERGT